MHLVGDNLVVYPTTYICAVSRYSLEEQMLCYIQCNNGRLVGFLMLYFMLRHNSMINKTKKSR